MGIGLRSLGIRVAKAYDAWDAAVSVYNHNAPKPVAVECDLLTRYGHNRVGGPAATECRTSTEANTSSQDLNSHPAAGG